MICVDCRSSVIGNIPGSLYGTHRCPKCHKVYVAKQKIIKDAEQKIKKKEEVKQKKIEDDDFIDDRFDILDL